MATSGAEADSCIVEAARLIMRNSGEAERLLAVHRPSVDGRCAGCGHSIARWPCALVAIARTAQLLVAGRPVKLEKDATPRRRRAFEK
jgi:hypothetical protein